MGLHFLYKHRHVLLDGITLAILLFLWKWLEMKFLVIIVLITYAEVLPVWLLVSLICALILTRKIV
jgi:hypothetical protein